MPGARSGPLEDGAHVPAAAWSCGTTPTGACSTSGAGHGPSRRPCGGRSVTRDRGCRFPGCGLRFCQGHHVQHWGNGGATRLDNLALLCRRHHRTVHEEGYQVERRPDGALLFRQPNGRPIPDVPPPTATPADPVGTFRGRHREQGLQIHARTGCPSWLGERLDLAWPIDVLHPLVRGGAGR
ncbi:MAG: HNH endonuclease signature motif containing protein [Candidatus Rokuibacteriota bacterium]